MLKCEEYLNKIPWNAVFSYKKKGIINNPWFRFARYNGFKGTVTVHSQGFTTMDVQSFWMDRDFEEDCINFIRHYSYVTRSVLTVSPNPYDPSFDTYLIFLQHNARMEATMKNISDYGTMIIRKHEQEALSNDIIIQVNK